MVQRRRTAHNAITVMLLLVGMFPAQDVEDMLVARGIIVSRQTVRMWAEKFGRRFVNVIRRRSAGVALPLNRVFLNLCGSFAVTQDAAMGGHANENEMVTRPRD
jgi:hypothetical protein